jgi:hypothetical protein
MRGGASHQRLWNLLSFRPLMRHSSRQTAPIKLLQRFATIAHESCGLRLRSLMIFIALLHTVQVLMCSMHDIQDTSLSTAQSAALDSCLPAAQEANEPHDDGTASEHEICPHSLGTHAPMIISAQSELALPVPSSTALSGAHSAFPSPPHSDPFRPPIAI